MKRPELAALGEPGGDDVLVVEVLPRGLGDDGRPGPAVGLQVEPAVNHPAQDRRVFDDQLFLQLLVALGRLEPERHQVEAAGQRLVDGGNARLGIADEYQFEARPELEKPLVHVAGGDAALVAGEQLDLADRPGAVFLRLGLAITSRASARRASSHRWASCFDAMNWLIGAAMA